MFEAIINVPGYLPMSDELQVFPTAGEAWGWLRDQRERDLDTLDYDEPEWDEDPCLEEIESMMDQGVPGVVYGRTPGSDSDHDLGVAYSVTQMSKVRVYAHAMQRGQWRLVAAPCDLHTADGGYTMICHTHHTSWPVTMGRLCPTVAPLIQAPTHVSYPHEPGRLYDCPLCESRCHCVQGPDGAVSEPCVFCAQQVFP